MENTEGVKGLSDPQTSREARIIADDFYEIIKRHNATRGAALHALMMLTAEVIRQHPNPEEALPTFLRASRIYVEGVLNLMPRI
jgi:hypothetical protein